MQTPTTRITLVLVLGALGCRSQADDTQLDETQPDDTQPDDTQPCGSLMLRYADEVALCNELDQPVLAIVSLPAGEPPPSGWPGVVVLHGSGGLFEGDGIECSDEMQDQFQRWRDLLNDQGYAVIMPDSFQSRGFCDGHSEFVPPELTEHERLIVRLFDARAAGRWLCDAPEVDCDALALLGFSNGASVTLLAMHDDLTDADDPRLHEHAAMPVFAGAVAYYPGCGLQGELSESTDAADRDDFYSPYAPVVVQHAEDDDLSETCSEVRDVQVAAIDAELGREDYFTLNVYEGAEHGFDTDEDDEEGQGAREAAQADTLERLDAFFTD